MGLESVAQRGMKQLQNVQRARIWRNWNMFWSWAVSKRRWRLRLGPLTRGFNREVTVGNHVETSPRTHDVKTSSLTSTPSHVSLPTCLQQVDDVQSGGPWPRWLNEQCSHAFHRACCTLSVCRNRIAVCSCFHFDGLKASLVFACSYTMAVVFQCPPLTPQENESFICLVWCVTWKVITCMPLKKKCVLYNRHFDRVVFKCYYELCYIKI